MGPATYRDTGYKPPVVFLQMMDNQEMDPFSVDISTERSNMPCLCKQRFSKLTCHIDTSWNQAL